MLQYRPMNRDELKTFIRRILLISVPIMIQNGITNLVSMLDNIMIGAVGTDQMSAAAITNQLIFVFNLTLFGGLSGIGIFTAQFAGKKDHKGIRDTFRLMCILASLITIAALTLFHFHGSSLISLYLHEDGSMSVTDTLNYAEQYLKIMCYGLPFFAATSAYSTLLRSDGETKAPMRASILAVLVNLIGNWILIFGHFGLPTMGINGAAIATVISRIAESAYLIRYTHKNHNRYPYIKEAFHSLSVPASLIKDCAVKGLPLLINETLWSAGQAALQQTYSTKGLSVVAAMNISTTISNVFAVSFIAMGTAISILLGQALGKGETDTVRTEANRLAVFTILFSAVCAIGLFAISSLFPKIYSTTDEIRSLSASITRIYAVCMPLYAYANAAYFTLRSGGKTWITFLFDSCFAWVISIPVAKLIAGHTDLSITHLYLAVQLLDILKCTIGFILVQKGAWIVNLTEGETK